MHVFSFIPFVGMFLIYQLENLKQCNLKGKQKINKIPITPS